MEPPRRLLRRLDAVLEPSKQAVLEMKASLDKAKITNQDQALRQAAGQAFYNTSKFRLRDLKNRGSQQALTADFEAYLDGFSPNVQGILNNFEFCGRLVGGSDSGRYVDVPLLMLPILSLKIMATYGYPLALVEHLSIPRGFGVLGSVYESGKSMRVRDVTLLTSLPPRSRYRTKSFAAVPITTGHEVIGVLCVTDRVDGRPFTQSDLSTLRTLAATMALALARERARAQAESYAEAAAIDPVSGLFNRRYFDARLEGELQRADRHALSVSLLMIDIDDFKLIDDTYGHLVGDMVIRDIADILRRSVRAFDICTRFGGEEFAVVMPGSGAEDAMRIANRIRELIEAYRPEDADLGLVKITASIGLAVSAQGTAARDLISHADQALYKAKRAGKNRVNAKM